MKGNCSYDAYHMHYIKDYYTAGVSKVPNSRNNEGAASVLKLGPIYCNENEM